MPHGNTIASSNSPDPRLLPAYTLAEVAHYLRTPETTLRSWVLGSRPLFTLDDRKGSYLSFLNLVEAHVLASIRRQHGIRLPISAGGSRLRARAVSLVPPADR